MAKRIRLTPDELVEAAKEHYKAEGWQVAAKFSKDTEAFVGGLERRPELMATYDGMEHFIFAVGRVTDATIHFQKQVLFDIDKKPRLSHVVIICEESVPKHREAVLRDMGVGVLLMRADATPLQLVKPRLRGFKARDDLDAVARRIRPKVRDALRQICVENTCIGVLDLVQIVEREMDRKIPATKDKPLGAKIKEAESKALLSTLAISAAGRINEPRIRRAHPKTHAQRRKHIVERVQSIVDDCLALLFALA